MSFLNTVISLELLDFLLILTIVIMLFQTPHLYFWLERRRLNPEGKIFTAARKYGLPILELCAMNGLIRFELGTKEIPGDPTFALDRATRNGIHLDPRLSSGGSPREFIRGAEIIHYSTATPTACSSTTAIGMKVILEYIRKNHSLLDFMPDFAVIEYINRAKDDLPHDCRNIVSSFDITGKFKVDEKSLTQFKKQIETTLIETYEEEGKEDPPTAEDIEEAYNSNLVEFTKDYQANGISDLFMQIQDEIVHLEIPNETRIFTFVEAFQNTPTATFASDMQNWLNTIELIEAKKRSMSERDKILIIAFAIVTVIIAGAVAMNMIPAR